MGRGSGKSLKNSHTGDKKAPAGLQTPVLSSTLFRQGAKDGLEKIGKTSPETPAPLADADIIFGKQVGYQAGSNPGGAFMGKDGKKRYVKFYDNPDRAYNEFAANSVYNAAGLPVPKSNLTMKDGQLVIANDWVDEADSGQLIGELQHNGKYPEDVAKKVVDNFITDFWLVNYDAMGLVGDNALVDAKGEVHRLDNGGALIFRARGKPKEEHQLTDPKFMQQDINDYIQGGDGGRRGFKPAFAALGIKDGSDPKFLEIIRPQIERLSKLREATNNFVDLLPFVEGVNPALRNRMLEVLQKRAEMIIGKPYQAPSK